MHSNSFNAIIRRVEGIFFTILQYPGKIYSTLLRSFVGWSNSWHTNIWNQNTAILYCLANENVKNYSQACGYHQIDMLTTNWIRAKSRNWTWTCSRHSINMHTQATIFSYYCTIKIAVLRIIFGYGDDRSGGLKTKTKRWTQSTDPWISLATLNVPRVSVAMAAEEYPKGGWSEWVIRRTVLGRDSQVFVPT